MNRIDRKFKELKARKQAAFIVYLCAGDPDIKTTKQLVLELENAGVDIIELGVPFSDPLADGPTIQRASQRALKNKVNLSKIFSLASSLRRKTDIPLILMTYYNPVYRYGIKRFVADAKKVGVDGVIVPDLSPEEAGELISISRKTDFSTIFLAAPTSTNKRIKLIAEKSTGFIYYVSLTGVTGARKNLTADIKKEVARVKRLTKKPICVGFGVSTSSQVKVLSGFCDGVIVGSAVINQLEKYLSYRKMIPQKVASFVKGFTEGGL